MAGCFFTDGKLVLSGYRNGYLTGIGGKRINDELPFQTAIRETVEELFEFETIDQNLLIELYNSLKFERCIASPSYTTFIMDFNDLRKIIVICSYYVNLKSKVYEKFPETVSDLIFNRKPINGSELRHLAIIPCKTPIIGCESFIGDIETFNNTMF